MTRCLRLIFALSIMFIATEAVSRGEAPATPIVSGKVALPSGQPVSGAYVALMNLDDKVTSTVLTNDQGLYWIKPPTPGRSVFFATKDDNASTYCTTLLEIGGQPSSRRIDFTLDPGIKISGLVYDQLNNPVPGVPIRLSYLINTRNADEGSILLPGIRNNVLSDEKGKYTFVGVPYTRGRFYDYSYGCDEPFDFGPGNNFTLRRKPVLKAQVVDAISKAPISHFRIFFREERVKEVSSADGTFEFEFPELEKPDEEPMNRAGRYWSAFRIEASGYRSGFERSGSSGGRAILAITPVNQISGNVIDAVTKNPLAGAEVYFRPQNQRFSFRAIPFQPDEARANDLRSVTNSKGSFSVSEDFEYGDLIIWAKGYAPRSLGWQDRKLLDTTALRVELSKGGVIKGSFGESAAEISYQVTKHWREDGDTTSCQIGRFKADKQGRFQIPDLEPGQYWIDPSAPINSVLPSINAGVSPSDIVDLGDLSGKFTLKIRSLEQGKPLPVYTTLRLLLPMGGTVEYQKSTYELAGEISYSNLPEGKYGIYVEGKSAIDDYTYSINREIALSKDVTETFQFVPPKRIDVKLTPAAGEEDRLDLIESVSLRNQDPKTDYNSPDFSIRCSKRGEGLYRGSLPRSGKYRIEVRWKDYKEFPFVSEDVYSLQSSGADQEIRVRLADTGQLRINLVFDDLTRGLDLLGVNLNRPHQSEHSVLKVKDSSRNQASSEILGPIPLGELSLKCHIDEYHEREANPELQNVRIEKGKITEVTIHLRKRSAGSD